MENNRPHTGLRDIILRLFHHTVAHAASSARQSSRRLAHTLKSTSGPTTLQLLNFLFRVFYVSRPHRVLVYK